jgi:16S rRNA (cytosine1402-N4)-methyltransferase
MGEFHTSVLLNKTIDLLQVKKNKQYIDATIGGGGHTGEILRLGGKVLGIDIDQNALDYVSKNFKFQIANSQLVLAKGNFRDLDEIAHLKNFDQVSGIIFDLGVSSYQINQPSRGFSFLREGPLDMRMDSKNPITAEYLVNILTKGELYEIFSKLGEEHRARAISNSIVRARQIKAIKTTERLAGIVQEAYGVKGKLSVYARTNINKRVFQALRIAVNDELGNIEQALPKALGLLENSGRLVVISFHSLEDRIVKDEFRRLWEKGEGEIVNKKPIEASREEIKENSRSKSAKLRVFERGV